jgi:beta-galactosidase
LLPKLAIPIAILLVAASLTSLLQGRILADDVPGVESTVPKPGVQGTQFQIRPYQGRPTLLVNDQPCFPMAYMSYYPKPAWYQQIGEHGVHFYSLSLSLTDKWFNRMSKRVLHNAPGLWKGPDTFDFSALEKSLQEIIDADPKALIFPRIYCDSPAWWDALHPDEVRTVFEGSPPRQSFSSLTWRNDTAGALRKIVHFVSESQFKSHVMGYMICAGQTEEYGDQPDFTPCAQQRFRQWIAKKYGEDAQTTAQLFGKPLEEIVIPTEAARKVGDCGNFLDPEKSRLTIDYRQFHSDEAVDSAITLCQAVKEASGGRLITGVFYGYTRIWPDWSHLALQRLLASDAVDFISNPYSSGGTKSHLWVGDRDFHTFTEIDSVRKAGKLFYFENDIRTSQSRWISQLRPDIDPKGEYNLDAWLGPPTVPDSLELLKAIFAKVLVHGSVNWWFDLWGGWYDHPEILKLFAEMQKVGDAGLRLPHRSVAQIAVVLDERSYDYLPDGVSQFGGKFSWIEAQLAQLGKVGAPYDFYLLSDLKDLDTTQYRMFVFLNAFALSKDQRNTIAEKCMSNDRLLMWLYAPGLIQDNLSVDNISSLLGMQFQMEPTQPASKIALNFAEKTTKYDGAAVSPFFFVRQGADASYGQTSTGQTVVAEKAGPYCRNLFVALPPLPWPAIQYFAKQANVHLYSESGEVVFASEHYLAIASAEAGKRTIRLPHEATLQELLILDGKEGIGPKNGKNTTFDLDFSAHRCRLFQVMP